MARSRLLAAALVLVLALVGYGGWRLTQRAAPAPTPAGQLQLSQRDLSQVVARAREQAEQAGGYGAILQQSAEAAQAQPAAVALSTAQATQAQDQALVRISGTVTQVGEGTFTVDDGSGPVVVEVAQGVALGASGLEAGRRVTVVGEAAGGRLTLLDQADLQLQ